MNNKIKFAYLVLWTMHFVAAMDQPGYIETPKDQVFSLVARYIDTHESICSFAATNKACLQSTILAKNERRKLLFDLPDPKDDNLLGLVVHKWGSAYCCAKKTRQDDEDRLLFRYCDIDYNNNKGFFFHGAVLPLPHKPAPFLNEKNQWCFDVKRKINEDRSGNVFYEVVRYNLSNMDCLPLKIRIGEIVYGMLDFCSNPCLIKSILNTKKAKQASVVLDSFFLGQPFTIESLEINLDDVTLEPNWNTGNLNLKTSVMEKLTQHYEKQTKS